MTHCSSLTELWVDFLSTELAVRRQEVALSIHMFTHSGLKLLSVFISMHYIRYSRLRFVNSGKRADPCRLKMELRWSWTGTVSSFSFWVTLYRRRYTVASEPQGSSKGSKPPVLQTFRAQEGHFVPSVGCFSGLEPQRLIGEVFYWDWFI